ncbi:MAG: FeoB-associated Cys-rich membrane protein [Candidatus Micrarchaeia archaeon]
MALFSGSTTLLFLIFAGLVAFAILFWILVYSGVKKRKAGKVVSRRCPFCGSERIQPDNYMHGKDPFVSQNPWYLSFPIFFMFGLPIGSAPSWVCQECLSEFFEPIEIYKLRGA